MTKYYPTWSLYVLLACGVVTFVFGVWMAYRAVKLNTFGVETEGTIIEYRPNRKNPQAVFGKSMVHRPIFAFIAKDGVKYTVSSSINEADKSYEIGQRIIVRYDTKNPKNAHISEQYPWTGSLVLMVIGLATLLFCAFEIKKRF